MWTTIGIRSYLEITEPLFKIFKEPDASNYDPFEHFFGIWDGAANSLVIAKDDRLISYGSLAAKERLISRLKNWVELGMPSVANMKLNVYPADVSFSAKDNQWIIKRRESQFLWHLSRE